MRRTVILFARAPALGRGKRRLAAGVGDVAAWRFQREGLARALRRLSAAGRWHLVLAVTPDREALRLRRIARAGTRVVAQGTGDLGARMARALTNAPPGPAVIVGTDIPELDSPRVRRAFAALGRADAVFGPAADGGYWLIGLARRRSKGVRLTGVRWSSADALADTMAVLPKDWAVEFIDRLTDVDDAADLARLRRRLSGAPEGGA